MGGVAELLGVFRRVAAAGARGVALRAFARCVAELRLEERVDEAAHTVLRLRAGVETFRLKKTEARARTGGAPNIENDANFRALLVRL